jgi:hypothetical protein
MATRPSETIASCYNDPASTTTQAGQKKYDPETRIPTPHFGHSEVRMYALTITVKRCVSRKNNFD